MYACLDRPVTSLAAPDRFLLDAMRAWVHALTLAGDAHRAVAEGFAARGARAQGDAFDAAMRLLDRGSTETLTFQRPCHATVEEDEAIVLGLWRLVRDDRMGDALATARLLVTAEVAPALVRAIAETERAGG